MSPRRRFSFVAALSSLAVVCATSPTRAQEVDVMVQMSSGQLVTGVADLPTSTFTVPQRVFTRNLLPNFRAADPGFFALSEGNPLLPADALPANTDLSWDFLPMTVGQTISNLFYWDALDDDFNGLDEQDVDFVRPLNANFKMINNGSFTADASDQMIPGGLIQTTSFDGSIHKHPAFRVETLDATTPLEGVYLISLQVRMPEIETSDPFYLAFRTSTLGDEVLVVAEDWIDANIDLLSSPPILAGDYNNDEVVDSLDYVVWRNNLGAPAGTLINDPNDVAIGLSQYDTWKANYGSTSPALAISTNRAVPEPANLSLLLFGFALSATCWRCMCGARLDSPVESRPAGYTVPITCNSR